MSLGTIEAGNVTLSHLCDCSNAESALLLLTFVWICPSTNKLTTTVVCYHHNQATYCPEVL